MTPNDGKIGHTTSGGVGSRISVGKKMHTKCRSIIAFSNVPKCDRALARTLIAITEKILPKHDTGNINRYELEGTIEENEIGKKGNQRKNECSKETRNEYKNKGLCRKTFAANNEKEMRIK